MTETQLLNRLKEEQIKFAVQALKQPSKCNEFEYGYRSGIIAGLELAISALLNIVNEEDSKDF